jgi:hypothetical protein
MNPAPRENPSPAPCLQRLAEQGKIDAKTAHRSQNIPEETLTACENLLTRLSFSSRRIFLEELADILADTTPDEAQKITSRILGAEKPEEELHRIRMPGLTQLEERFKDISSRLVRGTGVKLTAPPYFEGGRFTLTFSFAGKDELKRKIRVLEKIADQGEELYDLL